MSKNQSGDGNNPNDRRNVEKPSTMGKSDKLEESSSIQSFYSAQSSSTSFFSLESDQSVVKQRPGTSVDLSLQGWSEPLIKKGLLHIPEEQTNEIPVIDESRLVVREKVPVSGSLFPKAEEVGRKESELDVQGEPDSYLTEIEEYDRDEVDQINKVKKPKKYKQVKNLGESSSIELEKSEAKKTYLPTSLSEDSFLHESLAATPRISQIQELVHATSSLISSDNEKNKSNAEDPGKYNESEKKFPETQNIEKEKVESKDEYKDKPEYKPKDEDKIRPEDEDKNKPKDEDENKYEDKGKVEEKDKEANLEPNHLEKLNRGVTIGETSSKPYITDTNNYETDQDFNIHDLNLFGSKKKRGSIDSRMSRMTTNLTLGNAFIYMVIPPDGGYGWYVVLISFLCQLVVDGIIFSVGIVMPFMSEDYGVPPHSIVLVASTQIGPITSAFINKYGFRPVALAGSVISITTLLIASCSPNLVCMIIFYSLIGGPSLSMIWVTSQLIIGYYFERYRPIANGVSCAGAGAGLLIFSAMNSVITPLIGWRNTSRIHASFLFIVFLMSWSYVEVKPTRVAQLYEEESDSDDEIEHTHMHSFRFSATRSMAAESTRFMDRGIDLMLEDYDRVEKKPSFFRRWFKTCCPFLVKDKIIRVSTDEKRYVIRNDLMEKQDLFYTGGADYTINDDEAVMDVIDGRQVEIIGGKEQTINYRINTMQADRDSISTNLSFKQLRESRRHPCLAYISPANWLHPKIVRAFKMLFDLNMLKIMEFQILLLSAFLFPMGFNIPFVYSKMRAEIDSFNAALISPSIGLSNLIFRILSGFAAFKYKIYTTYICGGGIAFGGLFVLISAFYGADKVWFQYVYAFCYGVAPAFYSTLRAIIYVRTLGLEKLTNAFGLTAMAMGLGVFIGTTLAGILNDATGGYSASFTFSGICLISAGMLKLLLPSIVIWKEKIKMRKRKMKIEGTMHSPTKINFR